MSKLANICRLHRLYKISFPNGKKYVGQTVRLPEQRFKEHLRSSSNCTLLKQELQNTTGYTLETVAVTGSYDIDDLEKVAIALDDSVFPNGLNITVGGKGVVKPNDKYWNYKNEIRNIYESLSKNHFVSYDIMFMKNQTSLNEREFNAIKKLFTLKNR